MLFETEEMSSATEEADVEGIELVEKVPDTEETDSKETETTVKDVETQEPDNEPKNEVEPSGLEEEARESDSVMAETKQQEEPVDAEETQEEETFEDSGENKEETESAEILVASEDNIASGSDKNITWVIDANGKLTVERTGEFNHISFDWRKYKTDIVSEEINVTNATNVSHILYGCSELTEVDVSGLDTSKVTSMKDMIEF